MRITLPSGTSAELARPAGLDDGEAAPGGLVVFPDIGGLRPLFDDHCERLAEQTGWAVCAPEPWPGNTDKALAWRLDHVGDLDDERVLGDGSAAADATGAPTVAALGFCMGGMYALKAAGTGRFSRAVAFYGMIRVPDQWASDTQGQPLDYLARDERCPTMAIIGTEDVWTPPDDVSDLEALGVDVVRYEGAEHGFVHDESRPSHRPDDAADAWRRVLHFLRA